MISSGEILDIKKLATAMGIDTCDALPGMHCFTGCDTISAFHGLGKSGPFKIMTKSKVFTQAMKQLGQSFDLDNLPPCVEKFVCAIYSAGKESKINEARYKLFISKSFGVRKLPPTADALKLHTQRANYQCAIFKRALEQYIRAPSPALHGWIIEESRLSIKWMGQPPAPEELLTQTKCSCKKAECATKACSCVSKGISCNPDICNCQNCKT